jgi:hypothetical protein
MTLARMVALLVRPPEPLRLLNVFNLTVVSSVGRQMHAHHRAAVTRPAMQGKPRYG